MRCASVANREWLISVRFILIFAGGNYEKANLLCYIDKRITTNNLDLKSHVTTISEIYLPVGKVYFRQRINNHKNYTSKVRIFWICLNFYFLLLIFDSFIFRHWHLLFLTAVKYDNVLFIFNIWQLYVSLFSEMSCNYFNNRNI